MRSRTQLAADWPPNSEAALEAGHHRQSPLRAIREKCIDCSGGSVAEVRRCEAVACPLWPFRAGRHLWIASREKPLSDPPDFPEGEAFHAPLGRLQ
jgi:hypothetical protein